MSRNIRTTDRIRTSMHRITLVSSIDSTKSYSPCIPMVLKYAISILPAAPSPLFAFSLAFE